MRLSRSLLAAPALLAALALAGCGSASHNAAAPPAPTKAATFVLGSWHGRLSQRGLKPFDIRVTVGSLGNGSANRVSYTGINCGGHWTYLGTTAGSSVRFREVIDSGQSSTCKGVGEVTVMPAGAKLRYRFQGGGVQSTGVLSRG